MNYRRRNGPIGLGWLRIDIRIGRTFRRAVIWRVGGRRFVRRYRLVCIRIRFIRRGRPVGMTVRWRRRVIRSRWPIRLYWLRSALRVHRAIRLAVSRGIVGLNSFRWHRLRRLIRGRGPVGLHWFRRGVGTRRTICWVVTWGIVGLHCLWRRCRRLICYRWPIGLHWFRSFADIRGTFCRTVRGMAGNRCRFVAGSRGRLRGLPRLRLSILRLAWPVRHGQWGRDGLCGRGYFHRSFPAGG